MLSRVCVVTTSFPRYPGDLAGHFVLQELRGLPPDIKFDVVTPGDFDVPAYQDLGNIKVHRFRYFWPERWQRLAYGDGIPENIRTSLKARINVPAFLLSMAWAIHKHGSHADLIHAHWSTSCLAAMPARRSRPIAVTVRGSDVFSGNRFVQAANKFTLPHAAAVMIYSKACLPVLIEKGVAPDRIHSVPHGRPIPSESDISACRANAVRKAPQDTVQLLFVGRLAKVKAVSNLVDALAILRREKLAFHLTLVGDGAERLPLERKVAEAGLGSMVDFVGMVPTQEVRHFLAGADIFILPSVSEGFSNSLWEAMGFGLPCIATRVGGAGEIIESGKNGFLVPPNNAAALVQPLRLLIEDAARRGAIGGAARASVLSSPHSQSARAEAILRVYKQAIHDSSGKTG